MAHGNTGFMDKVALVTGAGGGIGAAVATELAARGAAVLAVDLKEEGVESTAARIRASGGRATALVADVSRPESHEAILARVLREFGKLHYAVNNAGISGAFGALPEINLDDWHRVINVNLNAICYGLQRQLPAIEASGGGAVVNTISIYAHLGLARLDAYTASKHAALGLTKSVAIAYATRNVRINAVSPGPIRTPMTEANPAETERIAASVPMKRMGLPHEIAKTVAFLLSDDASYITGAEIIVDGGRTLC